MSESVWLATSPDPGYPPLTRDLRVDVAVVGAGITGLTAAFELQKAGLTVAVLEQHALGHGMTGHTTAHLTQVFDTRLHQLVSDFGEDAARTIWEAGRVALDTIERLCDEEGIDGDFRRVPGYYYAYRDSDRDSVRQEVQLAQQLGFEAELVAEIPYPVPAFEAMRVPDQAQFHPLRYLSGLARRLKERGGQIFVQTPVSRIHSGQPARLTANGHTITADHLVLATHQPLHNPILVSKVISYQTYALGVTVAKGTFPQALAWDTADPYHYWRQQPMKDHDVVIVGGYDHRTGHEAETARCAGKLEAYVQEALRGRPHRVAYHWSGQVLEPVDGVPFIGRNGKAENEYIGTGYAGAGMTMGTYAGLLIRDLVLGRENPAARLFDPGRLNLRAGAVTFLRENLAYPKRILLDHPGREEVDLEALKPGEGKVVHLEGRQVAACRTAEGELHAVSAVCTHLGCTVHWNGAEGSWDCPCHGSRFGPAGDVLNGPTMQALPPVELPRPSKPRKP